LTAVLDGSWRVKSGQEAFEMMETFLRRYMPRTYATTTDEREDLRERLVDDVADDRARIGFYKLVRHHLQLHITFRGNRALMGYAERTYESLRDAIEVLHRKATYLYGARELDFFIRVLPGALRLPAINGHVEEGKALQILRQGPYTFIVFRSADFRDEIEAPISEDLLEKFLRQYRDEGAKYFKTNRASLLVAIGARHRPGPAHRAKDFVLNATLRALADYLAEHATGQFSRGGPRRRISQELVMAHIACVIAAYFRFVGPPGENQWTPDAASIGRQYRRIRKGRSRGPLDRSSSKHRRLRSK